MSDWIEQFFDDLVELWFDMWISLFEMFGNWFSAAVETIPVPDFLQNYSLDQLLSALPEPVVWILSQANLPEGLAILGAGVAFRLLRKLFTLGQW